MSAPAELEEARALGIASWAGGDRGTCIRIAASQITGHRIRAAPGCHESRHLATAAREGVRPVVVSGDCTTSLGTVAGLQQAGLDAAIVWLDAHGDVQTLETTPSGYLGGLPLRLLACDRPELIGERLGLRPVPEERVTLAGARDLDPSGSAAPGSRVMATPAVSARGGAGQRG